MSSFDIAAIVSEIKPKLIDAWIANIYQLDSLFSIKIRTKEGNQELLIEPSKRIHITKYDRPKPKIPSKFCMTLRKYLRNRRILDLKQYKFDRVVILNAGRKTPEGEIIELNSLIIEFFERGNLVLLNSENKVINALSYRTMRDRRVIPNREFNFAPARGIDLSELTLEKLKSIILNSELNLIRALIRNLNINPLFAEEICYRAKLDKNRMSSELKPEEFEKLYQNIENLLSQVKSGYLSPRIYHINSTDYLSPLELKQFSSENYKEYESFNEAADEFFSSKEEIQSKVVEIKNKETKLSKTEKILKNQKQAIARLEKDSIRYQRYGDLLYQHFQEIDEILSSIRKARNNKKSWDEIIKIFEEARQKNIILAEMVKNINYRNATLVLKLGGEEFPIDFRKSVAENANIYYNKAKKAVSKLEGARKAFEKLSKVKDEVELEAESVRKQEKKLIEKRKKQWYEKFHWFRSSDNFLIIGGRDLKTNELIYRKYLEKTDIFFHASFQGAPVVVVKAEGKEVPESTLKEAAQFAVTFSKAWKGQYGQADVFCVSGDQVSLTPPSGEYLRKGSFIIRGKRREFKNIPLELMVGVFFTEKFAIPMAGPPNAVKKHCQLFIRILFGKKTTAYLAKLIKKKFLATSKNDHQKVLIKNLPLDEIQRCLPGGTGDINE
ncbi:MAG: ribosome rescue protein RqcH [Candidatus Helarchaeota archaeon]